MRTSTTVGAPAVPISRDNFSDEIEVYEDMLRPCENQDAILGHVASRGDRNPRAPNKTPAGGGVNPLSEPRQDDDLLKESSNRDVNPFKAALYEGDRRRWRERARPCRPASAHGRPKYPDERAGRRPDPQQAQPGRQAGPNQRHRSEREPGRREPSRRTRPADR